MVRHGETDWNRDSRFQGHADPPLNEVGRVQAQELASELAGETFDAAYASPLERAHETARILAARLHLGVRLREALREVDVGSWSGLTRTEVEARFPDGYGRWLEYGHGWDDVRPTTSSERELSPAFAASQRCTQTDGFWPSRTEARSAPLSPPPRASHSTRRGGRFTSSGTAQSSVSRSETACCSE